MDDIHDARLVPFEHRTCVKRRVVRAAAMGLLDDERKLLQHVAMWGGHPTKFIAERIVRGHPTHEPPPMRPHPTDEIFSLKLIAERIIRALPEYLERSLPLMSPLLWNPSR